MDDRHTNTASSDNRGGSVMVDGDEKKADESGDQLLQQEEEETDAGQEQRGQPPSMAGQQQSATTAETDISNPIATMDSSITEWIASNGKDKVSRGEGISVENDLSSSAEPPAAVEEDSLVSGPVSSETNHVVAEIAIAPPPASPPPESSAVAEAPVAVSQQQFDQGGQDDPACSPVDGRDSVMNSSIDSHNSDDDHTSASSGSDDQHVGGAGISMDPMVLFGGGRSNDGNSNSNNVTDEKSVRTESTKPDPPSIFDTATTAKEDGDNNDDSADMENAELLMAEEFADARREVEQLAIGRLGEDDPNHHPQPTTGRDPSAMLNDLSEAEADAALAVLSTNVAEATLQDESKEEEHATEMFVDAEAAVMSPPRSTAFTDRMISGETGSIGTSLDSVPPADEPTTMMIEHTHVEERPEAARGVTGADNLLVLPRVDENRFFAHPQRQQPPQYVQPHSFLPPEVPRGIAHTARRHSQAYDQASQSSLLGYMPPISGGPAPPSVVMGMATVGRRKIRLRLQEEVRTSNKNIRRHIRRNTLLGTIKKSSTHLLGFGSSSKLNFDEHEDEAPLHQQVLYKSVDRGTVSVSWYEGTSSLELQQHVRKTVIRKLKLENESVELEDMRILDETVDPPEEIVLSPYIPDGAQFLLRFSTRSQAERREQDGAMTPSSQWSGRPPLSPSAAPSPHPDKDMLSSLNANQLALLNSLKVTQEGGLGKQISKRNLLRREMNKDGFRPSLNQETDGTDNPNNVNSPEDEARKKHEENAAGEEKVKSIEEGGDEEKDDDMMLHSEDPIESRLREITELLLTDRKRSRIYEKDQGEKRQVIFVVANYLVLFLALIAISAEIQARAPNWLKTMEDHLQSVADCSANQEALFECVSRGDFAGLIASVLLWLSRSVATRRIFLFGFDTPKKLWTVVYESLVTSLCWGISYLFIRRGMNPDTRHRFVQKYWKDAVYGSLAGFNAAFLKQILKNLIPQEVVEDALRERQLKILGWLPSFA